MNLDELRLQIDDIDSKIVELFCKRMDICKQVAEYKIANNLPVYHPEREKQIIEKLSQKAEKGMENAVERLYISIMDISKALQKNLICKDKGEIVLPNSDSAILDNCDVACQGASCAYSHIAAQEVFENGKYSFFDSFENVFKAVDAGLCTYGVVPIENTSAGSVTDNYDLMLKYNLYIVKSVSIKINHCLLGVKGAKLSDIKQIYSHPQALSQCSDFISQHKNMSARAYTNTATSAELIADSGDVSKSAIGSHECAQHYGLDIIKENIQNREENTTRFVVIAKKPISNPNCDRVSIAIRLNHEPAALYQALSVFAARGIDLLKLESRPIPESPFEFMFYCDFKGNIEDENVKSALQILLENTRLMRYIGNYPNE